ncbi:MAG: septal ring lytic transglycosylase RlpA family protein [Desulfomonile tiedjei]|nr:septal ring lytic transglycosylase RlpA family protein [Desulfomonile tiedjei]
MHQYNKLLQLTIISGLILLFCSACAQKAALVKKDTRRSYTVFGKKYYPMDKVSPGFAQCGVASWYGPGFHGKKTSSGEVYDMHGMTAAHCVLPLNTLVKVTNEATQKEIVVKINDRGPFVGERVIDLSLAAARKLGMEQKGITPVRVTVLGPADTMLASKQREPKDKNKETQQANPFFSKSRRWLASLWGT